MRFHAWVYNLACAVLLHRVGTADRAESAVISRPVGQRSSSSSTPGTCPSTSINYITHTLPQQCLWTTRTSVTSSRNSTTSLAEASASSAAIQPSSQSPTTSTDAINTPVVNVTYSILPTSVATSEQDVAASADSAVTPTQEVVTEAPTLTTLPSTTTLASSSTLFIESDGDPDSPLGDVKFLSFEEWKKQNLAQAGQSAEELAEGRRAASAGHDRNGPGHSSGLDTLGEESEIEFDFSGFGGVMKPEGVQQSSAAAAKESGASTSRPRSKDAGKTGKERFNYASFDCAANILKTSPRCKSSSSILVENKDSYMLNECSMKNKFIIVELCDDILIDTIVLANFEFFSSMFRTFRISVSDRYPVKLEKWKELGVFEARNSRDIQAFWVENPLIWARYLRIEFLSHYGSEYYCPVSLLRVHGTTMMEEYRREERAGGADADDEDDLAEVNEMPVVDVLSVTSPPASTETVESIISVESKSQSVAEASTSIDQDIPLTPSHSVLLDESKSKSETSSTATISSKNTANPTINTMDSAISSLETESKSVSGTISPIQPPPASQENPSKPPTTSIPSSSSMSNQSSQASTSLHSEQSKPQSSPSSPESASVSQGSTKSSSIPPNPPTKNNFTSASAATGASQPSQSSSSPPPHQQQQPGTQESIFKSIHKRLTSLESNSTLSLAYIESQSQLLLSTLTSLSKHQQSRIASFLDALNVTVSTELLTFKRDYDQLWQSTVLELAEQREEGRIEREVLGERVRILAEEMVGQKRVMAAQATALLVCAALLIFTRVGPGAGTSAVVSDVNLVKSLVDGGSVGLHNGPGNPAAVPSPKRRFGFSPSSPGSARRRWKWDNTIWPRSPSLAPSTSDHIALDHHDPGTSSNLSPTVRRSIPIDTKSDGEEDLSLDQAKLNRARARAGILGVQADPIYIDSNALAPNSAIDHDPTPTTARPSTAPGFVEPTACHFDDSSNYPSGSPSPPASASGSSSRSPSPSVDASVGAGSPGPSEMDEYLTDTGPSDVDGEEDYAEMGDEDEEEEEEDGKEDGEGMGLGIQRPGVVNVQSEPRVSVAHGFEEEV